MGKAVAHAEGKSADLKCGSILKRFVHGLASLDDFYECRNMIFPSDSECVRALA
jgi:hypothetical protein